MRGIVADANIEGHVRRLVERIVATDWIDFWNRLDVQLEAFSNIGLRSDSPDSEVWHVCQREHLVLLTANRNHDGSDSLDATIQAENVADSLPVLTVGDAEELRHSSAYADKVITRLIEILLDIDLYRGTGRLYIP